MRSNENTANVFTDMPVELALPRVNGEMVFESPWEARAFGLAVVLHEQGWFEWRVFSTALAKEIVAAESGGESSTYYERWLRALRHVTTSRSLLAEREIDVRIHDVSEHLRHEQDHHHHG